MKFLYSFQSEWLKTKKSAASWLCVLGGAFIPFIYLMVFVKNHMCLSKYPKNINVWETHFRQLWQNMSGLLLPLGLMLATSLIIQLEYKNNTWKQLHTTPQSYTTIFFSKFFVILVMTLKFFIFFNIGIIVSGVIPCLLFDGHLPSDPFPILLFIKGNLKVFITCLPILAFHYLLSLNFKNFVAPIGIGLLGVIGTLIGLSWKYIYFSPYCYGALLAMPPKEGINLLLFSICNFTVILSIAYYLFLTKKEKG